MKPIVYCNGEFIEEQSAKVSIFDRGFLFGDGVYEVVPVVNGKLIDKFEFLQRLERSLYELELEWPFSQLEYVDMLETLIERNKLLEGSVYTQVTRGVAPRDFAFPDNTPTTCIAFTSDKSFLNSPLVETGVDVITVEDLRWKRRDIKSIALLAQCIAKQQSKRKGCYESWMLEDGFITEGSSSTAYIVKDNTIITRPKSNDVLPGIRRHVLLELAADNGIAVELRAFTLDEVLAADEAFLSSATTLVMPVITIDGKPIAEKKPGLITLKLRQLYVNRIKKQAGL
ncbi:MAG: D-alanine transaminase [Candidatus Azotimanducaceae bacterium]|jgi:D-alanine transaminase